MPYIKTKNRPQFDALLKTMRKHRIKIGGDLYYILMHYARTCIKTGYNNIRDFNAELRECAIEIERIYAGGMTVTYPNYTNNVVTSPQAVRVIAREMKKAKLKINGDLNYVIFKFFKDNHAPSIREIGTVCTELRAAATQIDREILGPYEDTKITENGDV
jgi:hypothetical protein